MSEFLPGFADVLWYGKVHLSPLVIPIQGETDVFFAFPIFADVIMFA